MKLRYLYIFFVIITISIEISCGQYQEKKYSFNYIENAEDLNASTDKPYEGLVMGFSFYNKDKKIGKGGGWLIYKDGTIICHKIAKELYPNEKRPGRYFIDDLFHRDSVNSNVDSTMLDSFDVYLYLIDSRFLDLRLNTDGEGAGRTYSYYERYPLDIIIYKKEAGKNYFQEYDNYHLEKEEENTEWTKYFSNLIRKTSIESNIAK